jgi:hypothetical protein
MEYWSTGALRPVGIAPRFRGAGGAFRAHLPGHISSGLKPWARFCRPFGAKRYGAVTWNSAPHSLLLLAATARYIDPAKDAVELFGGASGIVKRFGVPEANSVAKG